MEEYNMDEIYNLPGPPPSLLRLPAQRWQLVGDSGGGAQWQHDATSDTLAFDTFLVVPPPPIVSHHTAVQQWEGSTWSRRIPYPQWGLGKPTHSRDFGHWEYLFLWLQDFYESTLLKLSTVVISPLTCCNWMLQISKRRRESVPACTPLN